MKDWERKSITDYTTDDDASDSLKPASSATPSAAHSILSTLWKQTGLSTASDILRNKRLSYNAQTHSAAIDRQILQHVLDSPLTAAAVTSSWYRETERALQCLIMSQRLVSGTAYKPEDLYKALCIRVRRRIQSAIDEAEGCNQPNVLQHPPSPLHAHTREVTELKQALEIMEDDSKFPEVENTIARLLETNAEWCPAVRRCLERTRREIYERPVHSIKETVEQGYVLSAEDRAVIFQESMGSDEWAMYQMFNTKYGGCSATFFRSGALFSCCGAFRKINTGFSCDLALSIYNLAIYDLCEYEEGRYCIRGMIESWRATAASNEMEHAVKLVVLCGLPLFGSLLPNSPLSKIFPEYQDGGLDSAVQFMKKKFVEASGGNAIELYVGEVGEELDLFIQRCVKEAGARRKQRMLDKMGYSPT